MGLFSGKLFDFNGDDHGDFGDHLFGTSAIGALLAAAAEADEADEEAEYDKQEALLEDMEMQLDQLNSQMPDDPDSPAYRHWEKNCEELEQKIDALADEIYG